MNLSSRSCLTLWGNHGNATDALSTVRESKTFPDIIRVVLWIWSVKSVPFKLLTCVLNLVSKRCYSYKYPLADPAIIEEFWNLMLSIINLWRPMSQWKMSKTAQNWQYWQSCAMFLLSLSELHLLISNLHEIIRHSSTFGWIFKSCLKVTCQLSQIQCNVVKFINYFKAMLDIFPFDIEPFFDKIILVMHFHKTGNKWHFG